MKEFAQPYIGVTDFMNRTEVKEAKACINKASGRRLHVGAMISRKTHLGEKTQKGWENFWLNEEGLRALFVQDDEVFNVLHYADYNANGKETTLQILLDVAEKGGKGLHGLQLDMVWPDPEMVRNFKEERPDLSLILQVSHLALKDSKKRGMLFWKDLEKYKDTVSYILLDAGMGEGKQFVPGEMVTQMNSASLVFNKRQMALGGGLGPDTSVNLIHPLRSNPFLSCDAQGQLHPDKNLLAPLDMERVKLYLERVSNLMTQYMHK